MMIHKHIEQHPRVEVPSWDPHPVYEDAIYSPQTKEYLTALKRYLPSSEIDDSGSETEWSSEVATEAYRCDKFRMYDFKVRKCGRGRSHDWTECPYAHPGEKARRRDPRKYHYSGTACPEFRRGSCRKGDSCEYAHGVFECWLHPARYRTQPCKDGPFCRRRVCFFAHSPQQLRVLPDSLLPPVPESPPHPLRYTGFSPTSVFDSFPESPPLSPSDELATAMRGLQVGKVGPRNVWSLCCNYNAGSGSLPTTPTRNTNTSSSAFPIFDEQVPMERVESGKDLRAKIYAKLCQDNPLDSLSSLPDFDWVSDLLK